jgi:hypothetical protein
MAERVGFEPTRTCALPVFETGALDQAMRPLLMLILMKQRNFNINPAEIQLISAPIIFESELDILSSKEYYTERRGPLYELRQVRKEATVSGQRGRLHFVFILLSPLYLFRPSFSFLYPFICSKK